MKVEAGSPQLLMTDASGKVTWSAPENTASIAARPDKRPRVFIEVWNDYGGFPPGEFDPRPTQDMATFSQRCP
ncbi:MAG: hypothetical protein ABSA70_16290, partial [Terriglobia bacterium]